MSTFTVIDAVTERRYLACLVPIDSHMPRLDSVSIGCEFNKAASVRYLRAADHLSPRLSRSPDDRLRAHATYNTAVPRPLTILARFPFHLSKRPFSIRARLLHVARNGLCLVMPLFLLRDLQKARKIASCKLIFRKTRHLNPNTPITELFY